MPGDFPSSGADYEVWDHPYNGSKYFWDNSKGSWVKMNMAGTRTYVGVDAPNITDPSLKPNKGDLWWDSHMLELRTWHKPDPPSDGSEPYVAGKWVSSTNPDMAPNEPNRNAMIGRLIVDGPTEVEEGLETEWTIERETTQNEKFLEYQWEVNPPEMLGTEVLLSNEGKGTTVLITWPEGTYYEDDRGRPAKYVVRCKVSAIDGSEDMFIEPVKYSPKTTVIPKPLNVTPLPYAELNEAATSSGGDPFISIVDKTLGVTQSDPDETLFDLQGYDGQFFLSYGATMDSGKTMKFAMKNHDDTPEINDYVGSQFQEDKEVNDGSIISGYKFDTDSIPGTGGPDGAIVYYWRLEGGSAITHAGKLRIRT